MDKAEAIMRIKDHIRIHGIGESPLNTWVKEALDVAISTLEQDSVEVVHAYWNVDDYDSGDPGYYSAYIEVHCSECGYELGAESGQYGWAYGDPFPLNYCPNCGSRMDGDSR